MSRRAYPDGAGAETAPVRMPSTAARMQQTQKARRCMLPRPNRVQERGLKRDYQEDEGKRTSYLSLRDLVAQRRKRTRGEAGLMSVF